MEKIIVLIKQELALKATFGGIVSIPSGSQQKQLSVLLTDEKPVKTCYSSESMAKDLSSFAMNSITRGRQKSRHHQRWNGVYRTKLDNKNSALILDKVLKIFREHEQLLEYYAE